VGVGRIESSQNILMIVIDTLRADHVGFMGGDVRTPNIDALAANGVVFDRAYVPIPITGPSHSSLFTSVDPHEHGVQNNGQILASSWRTLAEALEEGGWHTSAAVSLGVLNRGFGYRQGFHNYLDSFGRDWMKDAAEVTDEVLELVETGLPSPYFLFVHYSDPHEPYTPPGLEYPKADLRFGGETLAVIEAHGRGNRISLSVPPGRHALDFAPHSPSRRKFRVDTLRVIGKGVEIEKPDDWEVVAHHKRAPATYTSRFPATLHLVNDGLRTREVALDFIFKEYLSIAEVKVRYRQEVEFADAQIGRLLDGLRKLDLLRDTIIVFTSDHGEGLGQHNHLAHIHQVYDTLIRVPLTIALPGDDRNTRRVEQRVSLVDLFPTLAELVGVDPPNPASGRSLVPLMRGEDTQERPILAMTYRPEAFTDKRAIIMDGYKFIHSWSDEREWEELYDLAADPDELVDLIHDEPEIADRLRAELVERLRTSAQTPAEEAELSQQDLDRLQALGYVH
jgi:arylsulfatase A-like enzyme